MKTKNKVKAAVLVCCLFSTSSLFAAPSVTSVSGTITDGSAITISGSSFTTNSIVGTNALEFLGGKAGPINSGTAGTDFARAQWSFDPEWGNAIEYTTNNVPWGTNVLQMTGPYISSGSGNPEAPLYYKFPSPVTSSDHLYISWWQMTTFAGTGQYKVLRLEPTATVVDAPGQQDVYFFHNNGDGISYGIDGGPYALYPSFSPASPQSTWTRTDVDIVTSSPNSVTITKYTPGSAIQSINASSYDSSASSTDWNYICWQNYFGTDGSGNMTQGDIWFKDIYISHGTDARVELCDASTWSARKKCIIQPASSWSAGSIGVTLNQGNFASGTAYLYVVDSTGTANTSGFPVTIGSSTAASPPTPSNLTATLVQ